jgi:hypothetical protein
MTCSYTRYRGRGYEKRETSSVGWLLALEYDCGIKNGFLLAASRVAVVRGARRGKKSNHRTQILTRRACEIMTENSPVRKAPSGSGVGGWRIH